MKRTLSALVVFLCLAASLRRSRRSILRIPGSADRRIAAASLLGKDQVDVRLEDSAGNVTVYHGVPLLDVLEKNGLQTKTMAAERKTAPGVVLAVARDGYTVVFRSASCSCTAPIRACFSWPSRASARCRPSERPVRLIVYGDRVRSAYGLGRVELRYLGENPAQRK